MVVVRDEAYYRRVKALDPTHFAQCMNYLKGTGKKVCLLINFGSSKIEIKRIINSNELPLANQAIC
jgi:GxxExxY protein